MLFLCAAFVGAAGDSHFQGGLKERCASFLGKFSASSPISSSSLSHSPAPLLMEGSSAAGGAAAAGAKRGGRDQNVTVAVRVRPFNKRERGLNSKSVLEVTPGTNAIVITDPSPAKAAAGIAVDESSRKKTFAFDHVYSWDSTQEEVYTQLAKPIVDQALAGYNGTVFAYGQTGR